MAIQLRALTWDDPRGRGPSRPLAEAFARTEAGAGVDVQWDVQPLGGFESASVVEHARQYDVMVIDHPHVIEAAAAGLLAPIELDPDDCYVGPCLASYRWRGRQWAAPVDAASHVAAYRGRGTLPPATWAKFFEQATHGMRFGLPLRGVHALMALLTLLASMGAPFDAQAAEREPGAGLPGETDLLHALQLLFQISTVCVPESRNWNPLEALAALSDGFCDCLPLTFGYAHFQRRAVRFARIPAIDAERPPRPILGGTGMAVSAQRPHVETALALVRLAASGEVQVNLWPQHGGQPAHRKAWRRLAETDSFYRDAASSLEAAYVRPRCIGWNQFQTSAGEALNRWLSDGASSANDMAGQLRSSWYETTNINIKML
ncbi:MAG: hypothetical protein WD851_13110 [Pirellulales bacterium]